MDSPRSLASFLKKIQNMTWIYSVEGETQREKKLISVHRDNEEQANGNERGSNVIK